MKTRILNKYILPSLVAILSMVLIGCTDDFNHSSKEETQYEQFTMPERAMVVAEQSRRAIIITDISTGITVWSWDPYSANMPVSCQDWFKNPSECKPVLDNKYILMTASGGAVALIRINDHKMMYYANCGTNPHSAELLPDGNIVTAESGGEINTFVVDTVKVLGVKANTIKLGNAHNVVWDAKRNCLYATGTMQSGVTAVYRFTYNYDKESPKLSGQTRTYTFEKETGGHDLFPVYGEDGKLWLTAASAVYKLDVSADPVTCEKVYDLGDMKSIGNDANGVYMLRPTEEWWSDGIVDEQGKEWLHLKGARIYKARLMQFNTFSYNND